MDKEEETANCSMGHRKGNTRTVQRVIVVNVFVIFFFDVFWYRHLPHVEGGLCKDEME